MNTLSRKFESLIQSFPGAKASILELAELADSAGANGVLLTQEKLLNALSMRPSTSTARLLKAMEDAGVLVKLVTVESPRGLGGIGEFASIDEVPQRIHDWRVDETIDVRPADIKVMYQVAAPVADRL